MMRRIVSTSVSKFVSRHAMVKREVRFCSQRIPDAKKVKEVPKQTLGGIVKEQFVVFLADHLLGKVYSAVASGIVIVGTGGLVYYLFSSQLRSMGTAVTDLYKTVTGGISDKTDAAKERIKDVKERAKASLDAGRERASASIEGAREALKSGAGAGIEYVHDSVKNGAESIRSTAGAVKDNVSEKVGALGEKAADVKGRVGAGISGAVTTISGSLPGLPGSKPPATASSAEVQGDTSVSKEIPSKLQAAQQDAEKSLPGASLQTEKLPAKEGVRNEGGRLARAAQAAQGLMGRFGVRKGDSGGSAEDQGKDA